MRILRTDELYTGIIVASQNLYYLYELYFDLDELDVDEYAYRVVYRIDVSSPEVTRNCEIEIVMLEGNAIGGFEYVKKDDLKWFETDITRKLNLQKIRENKFKLLGIYEI